MSLLTYVHYKLSCPKCSPALLASCLTCSPTSRVWCPTCSHVSLTSCFTCFPAPRALVTYVVHALHALVSQVPRVLSASCLTYLVSSMSCTKPAFVSDVSYLLYIMCLVPSSCLEVARASNSTCSCAPFPSLTSGVSHQTFCFASHVLKNSCLVFLVLLLL